MAELLERNHAHDRFGGGKGQTGLERALVGGHSILTVTSQYPHSILTVTSQYPHEKTRAEIKIVAFYKKYQILGGVLLFKMANLLPDWVFS